MTDRSIELIGTGTDNLAIIELSQVTIDYDGSLGTGVITALMYADLVPLTTMEDISSAQPAICVSTMETLLAADLVPLTTMEDISSAQPALGASVTAAPLAADLVPLTPMPDASSARLPLAPNDPAMISAQGIIKFTVLNS